MIHPVSCRRRGRRFAGGGGAGACAPPANVTDAPDQCDHPTALTGTSASPRTQWPAADRPGRVQRRRQGASPDAGGASWGGACLLTPALLLRQERGHQARADPGFRSGRVAAAPELAAARRLLREAKRQPLTEDCDVRPRTACLRTAAFVPARDRRLSKRLRPPSGLSWAATSASTGRLVSTARACVAGDARSVVSAAKQSRGPLVRLGAGRSWGNEAQPRSRAQHDRCAAEAEGQGLRRPEVAGITGAARRWTVSMISALSIPWRYTDVIPRCACPSWRWMTTIGTPSCASSTA